MDSNISLGVDIIELKRAKAFYLAHRDRLPAAIRNHKRPVEALAFYLAKKEAIYKAQHKSRLRFSYFKTNKFVAVSCVGT
jgi:phosphopantetheinyl transferase (holo-ACP synthase)